MRCRVLDRPSNGKSSERERDALGLDDVPEAAHLGGEDEQLVQLAAMKERAYSGLLSAAIEVPPKPMREVAADFRTVFKSVDPYEGEAEGYCEVVQGRIPTALTGTLLRNGPALWERDGFTKEFLDGDGMVATVAIRDGRAYFRNKFVRTDSFVREQEAGRYLDNSIFTAKDCRDGSAWYNRLVGDMINGPPKPKDNAAYNVVYWADSLCAVSYKQPWKLDENNLDTIGHGKDRFSSLEFTAHYRPLREPGTDEYYMVTMDPKVDWAKGKSTYTFHESDKHGNVVRVGGPWEFEAGYNHDMVVTENWYVLFDSPVKMDYWKVFWGYPMEEESLGGTTVSNRDKRPRFRLFPRRGQLPEGEFLEVDVSRHTYAYHHVNAFEGEDGKVYFDSCIFDDYDLYFEATVLTDGETAYPTSQFCRFCIDPATQTCTDRILDDCPFEFPMINERFHGQPYQHSFQVAVAYQDEAGHYGPLQSMMKLSLDRAAGDAEKREVQWWHPGVHRFCHEPAVVCKPGAVEEDDVWVLSVVYDSRTKASELVILDGKDFGAGPVATVRLPGPSPIPKRGTFSTPCRTVGSTGSDPRSDPIGSLRDQLSVLLMKASILSKAVSRFCMEVA